MAPGLEDLGQNGRGLSRFFLAQQRREDFDVSLPVPKPRHTLRRQTADAEHHCVRPQFFMDLREGGGGVFGDEGENFHALRIRGNFEQRTSNIERRTWESSMFRVRCSMFVVKCLFIPSPESPPHSAPGRGPGLRNTKAPPGPKMCSRRNAGRPGAIAARTTAPADARPKASAE